jgi:predicted RNA-binding protein with RPS1 domain
LIGTLVLILLVGSIFINPFLDVFSLKSLSVLPNKEHISPKFRTSQNTKIFEKTKEALLAEITKQSNNKHTITAHS